MKMYLGGKWVDKSVEVPVVNPYDGSSRCFPEIDAVPRGQTPETWMRPSPARWRGHRLWPAFQPTNGIPF